MFRILLAEPLSPDAEQRLAAAATVVRPHDSRESPGGASLAAQIATCDALVARTHTPVTRELLQAGVENNGRLRIVGVAGVGLDRVDVDAARELGVRVVHTPGAASDAVAELAVELMLMLLRPVPRLAQQYRAGGFRAARETPHGVELCEQTVGIIGMGRIGSRVARICSAGFGARVLYNDIADVGPFPFAAERVDQERIWRESDFVSLHVPLTPATLRLVSADVLSRMRPAARLINTARGAAVDTDALVAALSTGRLAGAALDVTDPEPLPPDHPLFASDKCIVTPHVAARTHGGLRRMFDVVDAVIEGLSEIGR